MFDSPTSAELTKAVTEFLKTRVAPQLEGHDSYTMRVAINALGIVSRELESRRRFESEEQARLEEILGGTGDLDALNAQLCAKIRDREFTLNDKAVFRHLKQTAMDQVSLDQPRYSGLQYASEQDV